jgi:hypothetical protein
MTEKSEVMFKNTFLLETITKQHVKKLKLSNVV